MSIIEVSNVERSFKIKNREPGFKGAIKGLFSNEYHNIEAVKNISFKVEEGEILGYLGPNGSGKSTTIKMLVGILTPTRGKIEVAGLEPYKSRQENAKNIGIVFGQRTQLWWDIPVSETLNLLKYMYKIPESLYKQNIEMFNEILGIHEFINKPVRQLSLGQRMRADICAALIHNPSVIYLDEPTIGLDVVVKDKIRTFIKELNKEYKTTVILTTHDVGDIEKLCSRVMVIDKGQLIYTGNLEHLKDTYDEDIKLIIELSEELEYTSQIDLLGLKNIQVMGKHIELEFDKQDFILMDVVKYFADQYKVLDFKVKESDVEGVIRSIYSGNKSPKGIKEYESIL